MRSSSQVCNAWQHFHQRKVADKITKILVEHVFANPRENLASVVPVLILSASTRPTQRLPLTLSANKKFVVIS